MTAPVPEPASASADAAFEQRFARLEALLGELSQSTDPMLERATREVLSVVLELHRRGLERALEIAAGDVTVREALARDARVSAMLLLHGLHPIALAARVSEVLQTLRERLRNKLESIDYELTGAALVVRVMPEAKACGATRQALQKEVEDALLSAVPDAESVSVTLLEPAPVLLTLRLSRAALHDKSSAGTR